MAFPGLRRFVLSDVVATGKNLGAGSYGSVLELKVNGLVCAGKRLHDALLDRDNTGVANIERRYLDECQVIIANVLTNIICERCKPGHSTDLPRWYSSCR